MSLAIAEVQCKVIAYVDLKVKFKSVPRESHPYCDADLALSLKARVAATGEARSAQALYLGLHVQHHNPEVGL